MEDRFAQWLAGLVREWRMDARRKAVMKYAQGIVRMGYAVPNSAAIERMIYGHNEAFQCPTFPTAAGATTASKPTPGDASKSEARQRSADTIQPGAR
jgi:hypothetical protein